MKNIERAAKIAAKTVAETGASTPLLIGVGWKVAADLAEAGLLVTDADRAVLDAAEAWYGHPCAATRTGHPTVDALMAAVRARHDAADGHNRF